MTDKLLKIHTFVFNKQDNGGEGLLLSTKFYNNGDGEIYTNQDLTLQSYCNAASFNLAGAPITADLLRQLANELDRAETEAMREIGKKGTGIKLNQNV